MVGLLLWKRKTDKRCIRREKPDIIRKWYLVFLRKRYQVSEMSTFLIIKPDFEKITNLKKGHYYAGQRPVNCKRRVVVKAEYKAH